MKTYILKYPVHNYTDFPCGTIVELLPSEIGRFLVIEGDLKGTEGLVANGLDGWLLDDTAENRKLVQDFILKSKELREQLNAHIDAWGEIPPALIENH